MKKTKTVKGTPKLYYKFTLRHERNFWKTVNTNTVIV